MAQAMVAAGHAIVENANGKVKSIRLIPQPLHRIGEPTGTWGNIRFTKWLYLDCGARIIEHHRRCTDE
jgi:hypothetical protein